MSGLLGFYFGMSVALAAVYYSDLWEKAADNPQEKERAVKMAMLLPFLLLVLPVAMAPKFIDRFRALWTEAFEDKKEDNGS